MQESIQTILKRTQTYRILFLSGLLLLALAFIGNFSYGTFSVGIRSEAWGVASGVTGFIFIVLSLYLEFSGRFSTNSNNSDSLKVVAFSNRKDYTDYRTRRLRTAKKIDDVTWRFQGYNGQTYSSGDTSAKKEEVDIISQIIKRSDVVWRGVAAFRSLEQFEKEKPLISELENVGYNFGIYELSPKNAPPLTGFMIIDDKELFIAYPHKSIRLAIQHPQIIKLYSEYFEEIWQASYKLKQGNKVDFKKLQQLESKLE